MRYRVFSVPTYFCQVELRSADEVAENSCVNTFTFDGAGTADPMLDGEILANTLFDFYEQMVTADIFPSSVPDGIEIAVYSIDPASPVLGSPVYFAFRDDINGSGNALPSECAICLSFASDPVTGVPAARRRGRVFIGPLSSGLLVGSSPARPDLVQLQSVLDGYIDAITAVGTDDLTAVVWSRTSGDVFPVARAWIDDEFDTMRSRGTRATTRLSSP